MATEGRRLERRAQLCGLSVNKRKPVTRVSNCKFHNGKYISKTIQSSCKSPVQNVGDQSKKTIKPTTRLSNCKPHIKNQVKDASKSISQYRVSRSKSRTQILESHSKDTFQPRTRLAKSVKPQNVKDESKPISKPLPHVSNSKSKIQIVKKRKTPQKVRKKSVNISIVGDNVVTPILNKKCEPSSKKLKVDLLKLKLSSQEIKAKLNQNEEEGGICRCSAVLIIKDEVCEFIVDRVLAASKSKITRVPHSTRWLRPGPANPNDYGLDNRLEDMLEDTEDRPRREIPKWARDGTMLFKQGLKVTRAVDPDLLFAKCDPPYDDLMFLPMLKTKDSRSSWSSKAIVWDDD